MSSLAPTASLPASTTARAEEIFRTQEHINHCRTDRMFAWLMGLQWLAGIVTALWISPRTWAGEMSQTHIHVWAAIFLGAAVSGFPILLAVMRPGEVLTRHVIAAGQMLTSALLIHLTGGRIETHFHVFGSLAFLAFYRDWRVLVTATVVVVVDHALRGIYFPQSVFGVLTASPWRWIEHGGWVLFEDVFLFVAILHNLRMMYGLSERQARLEAVNSEIEQKVDERTAELQAENAERQRAERELVAAHKNLMAASRMAGMAEIATNVLHNVGNVLNSVNVSAGLASESVRQSRVEGLQRVMTLLEEHKEELGPFFKEHIQGRQVIPYLAILAEHLIVNQKATDKELESLRSNIEHIKEIVTMQQNYARVSGVKEIVDVGSMVDDSLRLNKGALTRHKIEVVKELDRLPPMNLDKHKVLLILTNLVRNAKYACDESKNPEKKLIVQAKQHNGHMRIVVQDTGVGIPAENLPRIFQHGFTTRPDGHGFGLHSSALAAKELGGTLTAHSDGQERGATFTLEIPVNGAEEK